MAINVFDMFAKISLDSKDFHSGLDSLKGAVSKSVDVISAAFAGATAAIGATATAVGGLAKKSLDAYADYEQLVGGVDKIFGESSAKVQEYANNAFKTAGMSANAYMETVTGFSASLLQGLNGDTEKAAEVADRAIRDMSDNANTYGSDMSSIQNAYMGFAKGNFQMLDNLKLGYGGTKEEMQRLISDASTMRKEMDELGVSVDADSMSFDNMINAISVLQKHMKISDTTKNEAEGTISGSIGSLKAAWENFLTGTGSPADFVDILVSSIGNISKQLKVIVPRLVSGLKEIALALKPQLPQIISDFLPIVIDGATQLLTAAAEILPDLLSELLPELTTAAAAVITALVTVLPNVLQSLVDAIPDVIVALSQNSDGLEKAGKELFKMLADGLVKGSDWVGTNASDIIGKLFDFLSSDELWNTIGSVWEVAVKIVENILDGLVSEETFNTIVQKAPEVTKKIVDGLVTAAGDIVRLGSELIAKLVDFLITGEDAGEHWADIADAALIIIQTLLDGLGAIGIEIWKGFETIGSTVADWLGIKEYHDLGVKMMEDWKDGIIDGWHEVQHFFEEVGQDIYDKLHPMEASQSKLDELLADSVNKSIQENSDYKKFLKDQEPLNIPGIPAYAKGGIVTKPTVALIGEAGPEAVVPLNGESGIGSFYIGNIEVNVNANGMNDINGVGDVITKSIDEALRRYQLQQSRGIGGTAW